MVHHINADGLSQSFKSWTVSFSRSPWASADVASRDGTAPGPRSPEASG